MALGVKAVHVHTWSGSLAGGKCVKYDGAVNAGTDAVLFSYCRFHKLVGPKGTFAQQCMVKYGGQQDGRQDLLGGHFSGNPSAGQAGGLQQVATESHGVK